MDIGQMLGGWGKVKKLLLAALCGIATPLFAATKTCELHQPSLASDLQDLTGSLVVSGNSALLTDPVGYTLSFDCDYAGRELWELDCFGHARGHPKTLTQLRATSLKPGAPLTVVYLNLNYIPNASGEKFVAIDLYSVTQCSD